MTSEIASEILEEWSVSDDDAPRPRLPKVQGPPRDWFAAANRKLPEEKRFRKLGELSEPVGADIYCAPWQPDEDDDEDDEE